jgi:hypothetical protein
LPSHIARKLAACRQIQVAVKPAVSAKMEHPLRSVIPVWFDSVVCN